MTRFQVDRVQHPIGQGGFHSMAMYTAHWNGFSMVVDCGGANEAHRTMLARTFAEGKQEHEFLAISHLDDDHINGLEDLKEAGVSFRTVFLPHVDASCYLKWMTLRVCGLSNGDELEKISSFAKTSVGLYSGRYGQVVRVGNPNPDVDDNDPTEPENDTDADQDPFRGPLTEEARRAIFEAKQKSGAGLSPNTSLTFRLDWQIRFYSPEWSYPKEVSDIWSTDALQGLKAVIDATGSNFDTVNWPKFSSSLSDELERKVDPSHWPPKPLTVGTSKAWVKLEKDVLGGKVSCKALLSSLYELCTSLHDYNDASMCVYAGPSDRGVTAPREQFLRTQDAPTLKTPLPQDTFSRTVGWIHTGDVGLKTEKQFDSFVQHYFSELPLTSVLVLPHHGSRRSFDARMAHLQDLCSRLARPTVFLAPADPSGRYHHPHAEVSRVCHLLGDMLVVHDGAASQYSESALTRNTPAYGAKCFLQSLVSY